MNRNEIEICEFEMHFNFNFNFNLIHSISIYNFTIASTRRVQESLIEAGEETYKFKERKGKKKKKKYFTNSTSCRKIRNYSVY